MASPLVLSAAAVRGIATPPTARIVGPRGERERNRLAFAAGVLAIVTVLLAIHLALGLVFDPRYKDFPFAPLTAAVVPFLTSSLVLPSRPGPRGAAELAAAGLLALSVIYIVPNEGAANWQSLWVCAALVVLVVSLVRVRGAPG